jgi:hypothetical protein
MAWFCEAIIIAQTFELRLYPSKLEQANKLKVLKLENLRACNSNCQ